MTIGIYKLTFIGLEDFPYIGQSINIEERFIKHKRNLLRNRSNFKMLAAYGITNQLPNLEILEKCTIEEISDREEYFIKKFDAVNNGLNINQFADIKGAGDRNGNSKHSNEQILKALDLLIQDTTLTEISKELNISIDSLSLIALGKSHNWLAEVEPSKYKKLLSKIGSRFNNNLDKSAEAKGIVYPLVISPSGEIFKVDNVNKFCKEHCLDQGNFNKVLLRYPQHKSHKGWKIYV